MKLVYPATFEKDGKYILVQFPDIPEAITQGATIEEAYEMSEEVLGLELEDKKDFPVATPVDIIQKQYPSKTVALIGIDLAAYRRKYHSKTIRKNVTIPEWLADLASEGNINFSQTLTDALKEKLRV
ncbi:type II toxin-antitoxin system HicB family antitoxin [uncultured Trichococcus sp.]|uniref:type II toxin-antitoxin system HicB family antitoxin n=1 Tax=uncultured Trichococcus sp. TaxID=189665 RepID=UPI002A18C7D6|nr:type II toxin-antitoxin system HicB family antitoxin [uncultured Trichococcus sp.]